MGTDEIIALGVTPCPGESLGGADSRYEPEYEALSAEIEKLTSVTQTSSCNWQVVADSAIALLSTKSKDFQAACYLAVALSFVQGIEGMASGTAMLVGLVRNFWETGFPVKKRMRGRLNAFEWWRERSISYIQTLQQAEPFPPDLLNNLTEQVRELDSALGEALPDFTPLRELVAYIGRLPVKEAPKPEIVAEPVPQVDTPPAAQSPAPPPPPSSVDTTLPPPAPPSPAVPSATPALPLTDDMQANSTAFVACAGEFADAALQSDLADPLGWQAKCMAHWGLMVKLPPEDNGTTMIPGPEEASASTLESLRSAGKMTELATAAKNLFAAHPMWLDVQYYLASALRALGEKYAPALAVVEGECRILVQRLAGLPRLRFADGRPFANAFTLEWLDGLLQSAASPATQNNDSHPAVADADALYANGQLKDALDTLDKALASTGPGPKRLSLRMAQARLLMQAGQWPAAVGLAEELTELCISARLADWAPEQATAALTLVREIWDGLGGETGMAKAWETGRMLARICPSAALKTA